jgi:hypothetical protein
LPDGTTDENEKITEPRPAVALFQQRTNFVEEFITSKHKEASHLRETVAALLTSSFKNNLKGLKKRPLFDDETPRLLLSFGGPSIECAKHPLQESIESKPSGPNTGGTGEKQDVAGEG